MNTIGGRLLRWGSADGTNTAAQFTYCSGVAVDTQGNLYVADSGNSTIRLGTQQSRVAFFVGEPAQTIDRQTGLFYQQVIVTNVGAGTITGLRISATNLPPSVRLVSSTGTNTSTAAPFIEFTNSLASGGTITFTLAYYSSNRQPPVGVGISVELVYVTPLVAGTGETVTVHRTFLRPDGKMVVEFDSLNGRAYAIEYSDELSLWKRAQSPVPGTGGRMIWTDLGPPDTESAPSTSRFYRVILLTQ